MSKPWFPVKKYGYGAGLPYRWRGWMIIIGYVAAITFVAVRWSSYSEEHPWRYFAAVAMLTAIAVFISWPKSEQPWRWRNGGNDGDHD
ncbi:hypothetical protein ACFWXH_25650 [Mesorhizobium sp. NPDC059054]|uniref:hypothetical protein n=1 Tax=Mesorhizobium sp. NPDC059054 TaxID=3346711 RepID=UPI00369CEA7F